MSLVASAVFFCSNISVYSKFLHCVFPGTSHMFLFAHVHACLWMCSETATRNFYSSTTIFIKQDSSVGIVNHYGLGGPGIESR